MGKHEGDCSIMFGRECDCGKPERTREFIKYYDDVDQRSDEWYALRCGVMTASQFKNLLTTKTLKVANNAETRTMAYDFAAQRETGNVEPSFQNHHMLRGQYEEELARDVYSENYEQVRECGFITNEMYGCKIGFSPDGLVGDSGFVEIKSRIQKHQLKTIIDGVVPLEYMMQIQVGLLVSGRSWCDFISYSNGMPLFVQRVVPMVDMHEKIVEAAQAFDAKVEEIRAEYRERASSLIQCERVPILLDDWGN